METQMLLLSKPNPSVSPKGFSLAQRLISLSLILSILLLGCGGHAPNPVGRYIIGDEDKSAEALKAEVAAIDDEIAVKNKEKFDRDIWNIIFIGTGIFVIFPFFFIDAKGSQEAEIAALKARKTQIMGLYHQKKNKDTLQEERLREEIREERLKEEMRKEMREGSSSQ